MHYMCDTYINYMCGVLVYCFLLPLLLQILSLEAQFMKIFVKMCKTMYFSEYKSVSFLFQFCMERANSLMGIHLFLYVNSQV